MKFRDILNESANTPVQDIQQIQHDKLFLLIIGGSASGKNYVFDKYFNIQLVDVDAITFKLSGGDFDQARKLVSTAVHQANREILSAFERGTSVAQVTTGSGAKAVINKINKAKSFGFNTAVILVDVDVNTAIKRNHQRALSGSQGSIPDWKVEKTNKAAKNTFHVVSAVADYSTRIK